MYATFSQLVKAACEISGHMKMIRRIGFCEAWVFKSSILAILKRIKRKSLDKGIQYQKVFWYLRRGSVEIIFKNL